MSDVLAKLEDRIKGWENNSDKARVAVKLGLLRELRNALAAATRKLNPPFAHDARCDSPCLDVTCLGCVIATHDALQHQVEGLTRERDEARAQRDAAEKICEGWEHAMRPENLPREPAPPASAGERDE